MNILIADDDLTTLILLSKFFKEKKYTVFTANNGEEAIKIILSNQINILITDWMMPNMSGLELCKTIRNIRFDHYIYIIMLTSKNTKDEIIEGIEAGADDFIIKPVNFHELSVKIRSSQRILDLEKELSDKNKNLEKVLDINKKVLEELEDAYALITKELSAAALLQKSLLPNKEKNTIELLKNDDLSNKNCISKIKFDYLFLPSLFLAGDLFNVFRIDESHIGFFHMDVAGHGVASAIISFLISRYFSPFNNNSLKKTINEEPYYEILPPSEVITNLNNSFFKELDSMQYFTITYGVLNTVSKNLNVVLAGSTPIIILKSDGETIKLDNKNLPVGILEGNEFESDSIDLGIGDKLFLYSDGITECMNEKEEQFSDDRLITFLKNNKNLDLSVMLSNLQTKLSNWNNNNSFEDDISLLVIDLI
jgi:sigma-B regulation protein RsbU (phosphoserine phosphatase)